MPFLRHVALILFAASALAQTPEGSPAVAEPPVALVPEATGSVPPEQMRTLLLHAEDKDLENDRRLRDYTYTERQEEHKLDSNGNVAKTEIRTSEILQKN